MAIKLTTPYSLNKTARFIKDHIDANPADDATAVLTALQAEDTSEQSARLGEALTKMKRDFKLEPEIVGTISDVTITGAGTGYQAGQEIAITGDGTGARITVGTVDGSGVILTANISQSGINYTTATLDLTAIGNGDATATTTLLTLASETALIDGIIAAL
jgi:hypothetical protein